MYFPANFQFFFLIYLLFSDIKKDVHSEENQLITPLFFLIKSLTSFVINTLSLCACNEKKISQNALNAVASFFIDSLRSVVDSSVSAWGEKDSFYQEDSLTKVIISSNLFIYLSLVSILVKFWESQWHFIYFHNLSTM